MQYMMMPLDAHYDSGFGAVAEAFWEAAVELKKAVPTPTFFGHLPQSFLYRHAVELFLKSEIIILHRRLDLPYGTARSDGPPMILVSGKWKQIYKVHSVGILYEHWKSLINPRLHELANMTKFKADWRIEAEVDDWVKVIDAVDPGSTYSRYPSVVDVSEDQGKSSFKEATPEELFPQNAPEDRMIITLLLENDAGEIVRAFMHDKGTQPDEAYMKALEAMCGMLSNYHAMMRMELTDGF